MPYKYLEDYIQQLQSKGRYSFTMREVEKVFARDKTALHMGLRRLRDKNRIVRVRNGFYVIVPAEYLQQGILPPLLFIDDLMSFLNRPYYVSLLSAAALHGAGHQQPLWLQVVVDKPQIRPIQVKGVGIRFISKKNFSQEGLSQKTTETGYIKVSNPMLTALDLIQFERHAGSFLRVAEVLGELSESFNEADMDPVLKNDFPVSVFQRFGYLCEKFLNYPDIADEVYLYLKNKKIHPLPLSSAGGRTGAIEKKWQIILNVKLDDLE